VDARTGNSGVCRNSAIDNLQVNTTGEYTTLSVAGGVMADNRVDDLQSPSSRVRMARFEA